MVVAVQAGQLIDSLTPSVKTQELMFECMLTLNIHRIHEFS